MSEFVTAKDELANLIETGIIDLGLASQEVAMDAAILLVQKMETASLLPVLREYRVGDPHEEFSFDMPAPEVFPEPPTLEGDQYLLTRLCTPWFGGAL